MIFHPIRLALVFAVCAVLGINGADAKPRHTPAPAAKPAPKAVPGTLARCLETAAADPVRVQACVRAVRAAR